MILIVAVVPAVGVVVLCVCLLCCFLYCAGCSRKKAVKSVRSEMVVRPRIAGWPKPFYSVAYYQKHYRVYCQIS